MLLLTCLKIRSCIEYQMKKFKHFKNFKIFIECLLHTTHSFLECLKIFLLEIFEKATITIPLIDSISNIPYYFKFSKDLCTSSRKPMRVHLSKSVSSILLNDIPRKRRDLGAPLIACEIERIIFNRSLLDSRTSVNVMPKYLYDTFKFGDLEPIILEWKLTDGSIREPTM